MVHYKLSGYTLIEVLVSLLLLSVMLLGMDVMQIFALRQSRAAYYLSVAHTQMQSISERLRMTATLDPAMTISAWNTENALVLPQGVGYVRGSYPVYHAQLCWGGALCLEKNILV